MFYYGGNVANLCYFYYFQSAFKLEYKNEARLLYGITAVRYRSTSPLNTIIMFVPQQEVSIVSFYF